MSTDLKDIGFIYTVSLLICWLIISSIQTDRDISKLKEEQLSIKTLVVEYHNDLNTSLEMVESLNNALDDYMYLEKLQKDIRRHW